MIEQLHEQAWVSGDLEIPFGRGINFQIELSDVSPVHSRLKAEKIQLFRELKETWYDIGDKFSGQREFLSGSI